MWFGLSKRQFHRRCSGSQNPVGVAAVPVQSTVQTPVALPGLKRLVHGRWQGIEGLSGICPAWTLLGCLPGHSGYHKTRRGQYAQKTI